MARVGHVIHHPLFGERITFEECIATSAGAHGTRLRVMEPACPHKTRAYIHATLIETCVVLHGLARCSVGATEYVLAKDDHLVMPPQ